MSSSNSVQASDLVGLYLLYELNSTMPELDGGLFRDDASLSLENLLQDKKNIIKYSMGFLKLLRP